MNKECTVDNTTYLAVESTELSCQGCSARYNPALCLKLDNCVELQIVWQEKTEQLLDEDKQYPIID